jgi:hypothetical protein
MLRYNNWINQCQDVLTGSPLALPSDKSLVAWVKLMHISEEIGTSFSFDDPGNMVALSESRAPLLLRGFEKSLGIWRRQFDSEGMHGQCILNPWIAPILTIQTMRYYLHTTTRISSSMKWHCTMNILRRTSDHPSNLTR